MSKLKEEIEQIEKYQDFLLKSFQANQIEPTKLIQDGELMLFQTQTIAQVDDTIYHLSANPDAFILHSLQFNKQPIQIKVKLLDPHTDKQIDYLQYLGDPYDFEVQSNTAILLIKSNHGKSKRPLIKAVFKATIQPNSVVFYQLSNIKYCLQVKIHPLNPNYICVLGTTKEWNKVMAQEKDQVFSIYNVNNLFKPDLRINLNQQIQQSAITFAFSDSIDQNQCFVYFSTLSGKLYSYNLLLDNLSISHKTMTYLKQTEFKQFVNAPFELRDKNQIILKYDKQLYNPQKQFEQITFNPIKSLQGECVLLLKLPYQMHLFMVVMKLETQNLRFLLLMGEDLKSIQLVYDNHIYLDELPNNKTQDGRSLLVSKQIPYCQPKFVKQQISIVNQSDCPFDLQNRANCLIYYRNTLIHIDYSELTKLSLEPSAIQINCFNVSENEENQVDVIQQQYCILQCFCTEIKNRKTLIIHKIDKQNHLFINLNMQTLFNLAHKQEPIRIDANLSQTQMQQYQLHKQDLKECRKQLLKFQNKCQTINKESDLVLLNEEIMRCVQATIFPCAKNISYEYEQMDKMLGDLKKNSEILKSSKLNSDLNQSVIENNERIYYELFHSDNLKNNGEQAKLALVRQDINDVNQKYAEIRQTYLNSKSNFENMLHSQQLDKNKMGSQIHQSLMQQLTQYAEKIKLKQ